MKEWKWAFGVFLASIILSVLSWKWFGNEFYLGETLLLDINFFATVCNFLSVIGLGLTVYQVSKLRREEEIRLSEQQKWIKANTKSSCLIKCGGIKSLLEQLQNKITEQKRFTYEIIFEYSYTTNECLQIVKYINDIQSDLTEGILMDGSEVLSLLEQLYTEFSQMEEAVIREFPKQQYLLKVKALLLLIETCESNLKR